MRERAPSGRGELPRDERRPDPNFDPKCANKGPVRERLGENAGVRVGGGLNTRSGPGMAITGFISLQLQLSSPFFVRRTVNYDGHASLDEPKWMTRLSLSLSLSLSLFLSLSFRLTLAPRIV